MRPHQPDLHKQAEDYELQLPYQSRTVSEQAQIDCPLNGFCA
jgi:hypothetical protein